MSSLQVCFWEFLSNYDTRPRTRDATLELPRLVQQVLGLPADGKTYCRVQNADGDILELRREDGARLRIEPLKPSGQTALVSEGDLDEHLARFAGCV